MEAQGSNFHTLSDGSRSESQIAASAGSALGPGPASSSSANPAAPTAPGAQPPCHLSDTDALPLVVPSVSAPVVTVASTPPPPPPASPVSYLRSSSPLTPSSLDPSPPTETTPCLRDPLLFPQLGPRTLEVSDATEQLASATICDAWPSVQRQLRWGLVGGQSARPRVIQPTGWELQLMMVINGLVENTLKANGASGRHWKRGPALPRCLRVRLHTPVGLVCSSSRCGGGQQLRRLRPHLRL